MKKTLLILCAALLGTVFVNASPFTYYKNDKYYFQVSGAYNILTNSSATDPAGTFDKLKNSNGFGVAAAVGRYYDPIRIELEYSYKGGKTEEVLGSIPTGRSGDLSYNSLMANMIYEAPLGNVMYVYLGVGAGAAMVNLDINGNDDTAVTFAYQAMFGLGYNLTREMSLTLGYRFFRTLDTSHNIGGANINVDPASINGLELGLKINF